LIRATLELKRAEPASGPANSFDRAVQLLPPSRQYEAALNFRPTWIRGLAYLQAKNGALAAAEFQRIIEHRGWDVLSPLWPMAHLGLARAAILQGDTAKGRKAYEDFFQLWKDADAELPILIEARKSTRVEVGTNQHSKTVSARSISIRLDTCVWSVSRVLKTFNSQRNCDSLRRV
jgi:hypothetical protein